MLAGALMLGTSGCDDAADGSESGAPVAVEVRWIEVFASDYKLDLEPSFDRQRTDYEALADGPDIRVFVDVLVEGDPESITINSQPATEIRPFTWRSSDAQMLISPLELEIEVDGAELSTFTIEVTVP